MNRTVKTHSLSRIFLFIFLLVLPGIAFSYTADDIVAAKGDPALIKKIIADEATENAVQVQALYSLPRAIIGTYFNSAVYLANPGI